VIPACGEERGVCRVRRHGYRPLVVNDWIAMIGLDPSNYGAHSLHRTKVAMVYKRTDNLRDCQLFLGHAKLESTVRYLRVEADDALVLSEQIEI
jgi:integrase